MYGFIIVPKFIRDGIYNWIAKNRYRWFGKKEVCMVPTPEVRSRFLNETSMKNKKTLVLGATTNPARYSYLAINKLREKGTMWWQ